MSETWLKNHNTGLYGFDSYYHSYKCRGGRTGGGVSILTHEKYNTEAITELEDIMDNTAESLFVKISKFPQNSSTPAIFGIIYRPPNSSVTSFLSKFDQLLATLDSMHVKFHLAGDFNVDLLSYPTGCELPEPQKLSLTII